MDEIMIYKRKPLEVEAFRFSGSFDDAYRAMDWINFEQSTAVDARVEKNDRFSIVIGDLSNEYNIIHPGDWIVKGVTGKFYPIKNQTFLRSYIVKDLNPTYKAIQRFRKEVENNITWALQYTTNTSGMAFGILRNEGYDPKPSYDDNGKSLLSYNPCRNRKHQSARFVLNHGDWIIRRFIEARVEIYPRSPDAFEKIYERKE